MSDLLTQVRELAGQLGRSPTQRELRVARIWHCGNAGFQRLNDLLAAAGLPLRPTNEGRKYDAATLQTMREEMWRRTVSLADAIGRTPTDRELRAAGIWGPGKAGYALVSQLLEAAGLPLRPRAVRLGSQSDRTALRRLGPYDSVTKRRKPELEALPPLPELLAEGERRSAFRLKSYNAIHPHRRRDDAELPFDRWMA